MDITFAPNGYLQIDNARIPFKNFSGAAGKFNREGQRDFVLAIDPGTITDRRGTRQASAQDIADALMDDVNRFGVGWNVSIKPPKNEDDNPFINLRVKIGNFSDLGPFVYLITNGRKNKLDEETIGLLDNVYMSNVRLDIRPYDLEVNGRAYRSAYLQSIEVTQDIRDRFAEEEYPGEMPFN